MDSQPDWERLDRALEELRHQTDQTPPAGLHGRIMARVRRTPQRRFPAVRRLPLAAVLAAAMLVFALGVGHWAGEKLERKDAALLSVPASGDTGAAANAAPTEDEKTALAENGNADTVSVDDGNRDLAGGVSNDAASPESKEIVPVGGSNPAAAPSEDEEMALMDTAASTVAPRVASPAQQAQQYASSPTTFSAGVQSYQETMALTLTWAEAREFVEGLAYTLDADGTRRYLIPVEKLPESLRVPGETGPQLVLVTDAPSEE